MRGKNHAYIGVALFMKSIWSAAVLLVCLSTFFLYRPLVNDAHAENSLSQTQLSLLGQKLFFDASLSSPEGQSCASCHQPAFAYADKGKVISSGATAALFANRNAPSLNYASFTPSWHFNEEDETWIGGLFADGRSLTLEDQALKPIFNPLEMGVNNETELLNKLKTAPYAKEIERLLGERVWQDASAVAQLTAKALSAFERSEIFANRFSSKYDAYLRGEAVLSVAEKRGLAVFEGEDKGNCAACHPSQIGPNGEWPLFTDFSYDNLGVPKNPDLAFLKMAKHVNPKGSDYVDPGLSENPHINNKAAQLGKFKVPTLRNIALTAPYMHNGFFADLRESVAFYNIRDTSEKWSTPEIKENVNTEELGDLKLTEQQIDDLVIFLNTLTDNWQADSVQ